MNEYESAVLENFMCHYCGGEVSLRKRKDEDIYNVFCNKCGNREYTLHTTADDAIVSALNNGIIEYL